MCVSFKIKIIFSIGLHLGFGDRTREGGAVTQQRSSGSSKKMFRIKLLGIKI